MRNTESVGTGKRFSGRRYLIIYIVTAVLIAAGILNGGMGDVFIKAIYICTECIGLG